MFKMVIIIILYILSVWLARKCTLLGYKDMINKLTRFDALLCFLPIFNFIPIFAYPLLIGIKGIEGKRSAVTDWFFKR